MRTSVATVCLSGTLAEKLRAASDAGYDGVEIFEQDLVVSPHSPEQIRARGEQLGLSFDLYQPFRDLDGVGEEQFLDNLRRLESKFRIMQRLNVDMILICTNVGTATIDDDEVCASQLRRAGELAAGYGIRLAYEALAWGKYVNTYRHAYRIVELADHPNVGTCLDSFHILSRADDPSGIVDIPAEKIFFVQLADAPRRDMDLLSWSRHHRVFPGEGDFDLVEFLRLLAVAGYDGPVSLEIFNDSFRQADVSRTAVDGLRSLLEANRVTTDNLPPDLLALWRTKDGQLRVQAVPKGDPNDNDVLRSFADAVLKVEPLAVGGPVSILRSGDTIVTAFIHAGLWALLSISLLLWLVLRKLTDVLLTIVPLLVAGAVTLEVCVLVGLPLNFANIIALPLLLGVGVAFKIYYVTAWRAGQTNLLQSSLTRAIFFSAMTTVTAFGSLWLSSHPGTASMGKLLALSFVATLAAVLLFQPALMGKPRDVGK